MKAVMRGLQIGMECIFGENRGADSPIEQDVSILYTLLKEIYPETLLTWRDIFLALTRARTHERMEYTQRTLFLDSQVSNNSQGIKDSFDSMVQMILVTPRPMI
jgi:hypothetical protein